MAMGNFPYPSTYILNGDGVLPAFPVRVACEYLSEDLTGDDKIDEWLIGLSNFAGVYYNYTSTLTCNKLSSPVNPESEIVNTLWNYQYCSQIFQLFGQGDDESDMFWDAPWDGPWHGLHIFPKKNEKTHLLEFTRPSFWGPSTKKKTCWGKMSPKKNGQKMASAPPCILIPI